MNNFETTTSLIKAFMVLVVTLIIGAFVFKINLITTARHNNKPVYEIEVNNFQNMETYTTTEYTRDQNTGCIKFKDEFGIKHTVCNNYTITEY